MNKIRQNFRRFLQDFYLVLIMLFLYAPIATMVVLSFNSSKSRTQWGGFTLQWYTQMFASRTIMDALCEHPADRIFVRTDRHHHRHCGFHRHQQHETASADHRHGNHQYPDAECGYRDRHLPDAGLYRFRHFPGL